MCFLKDKYFNLFFLIRISSAPVGQDQSNFKEEQASPGREADVPFARRLSPIPAEIIARRWRAQPWHVFLGSGC